MNPLRVLYVTTPRYDFTTATLVQGFNGLPGVELKTTARGNYAMPAQVLNRDDAIAYGRTADLVMWGYTRGADADIFLSIVAKGPVRVFIDGGDNSELSVSLKRLPSIDAVFKREFFLEDASLSNLLRLVWHVRPGIWGRVRRHPLVPFPSIVGMKNQTRAIDVVRNIVVRKSIGKFHPFPYGIEERFQGSINQQPRFELSCMVTRHLPERAEFMARLESLHLAGAFIGEMPADHDDVQRLVDMGAVDPNNKRHVELGHNPRYYARIQDSRRSISIPGGGFDTLRFWEIVGLGSLLVSKRIAIEMPHPFVEGTHYLAFDSFAELRDVLLESYRQPDRADEIRTRGHEWAMQFHTTRARAMYVLGTLVEHGLLAREQMPSVAAEELVH